MRDKRARRTHATENKALGTVLLLWQFCLSLYIYTSLSGLGNSRKCFSRKTDVTLWISASKDFTVLKYFKIDDFTSYLGNMLTLLLILLFLYATEERDTFHNQSKKIDSLSQRYLYHRFHAGTTWQVYLPVMTYDLLYSSIYLDRSSNHRNTQRTLFDVTSNLPRVMADRHPCGNSTYVISAVRWRRQLHFQFAGFSTFLLSDSRICGFHRITYIPGFDIGMIKPPHPPITEPLVIRCVMRSFGLFYSNITLNW